jgi:23S rRNA (cytosine1962-C5)-methyltransferase
LLRDDALKWLARARRRRERFDLIVLDPPTFASSGRGRHFSVERDYVTAARDALALLSPGGRLLAVVNYRGVSQAALRRVLHEAVRQAGRSLRQMKDIASPLDCPPIYGEPYPSRSVLVTVA